MYLERMGCVFWSDIGYLKSGSDRQRDAFRVLIELDLLSVLAEYDPVLAGTLPLGIETPESDLDILCHVDDAARFETLVTVMYGDEDDFALYHTEKNGLPTVICRFNAKGFPIEIFAQPRATEEQNAYRHLVAEARLLREGGEEAVLAIRELKARGMETEPAFGDYFCLPGDPHMTLLDVADYSASELSEVVIQARIERRNRPPEPLAVWSAARP
jgi:hypothetical protein